MPNAPPSKACSTKCGLNVPSWKLAKRRTGFALVFDVMGNLYTMPARGGAATQVSEGLAFDSQPRFSADGHWITFTSDGRANATARRTSGSRIPMVRRPA